MPSPGPQSARVATCEDFDEKTQSALPGSRTTANVTKKRSQNSVSEPILSHDKKSQDGSDSGYSSKTNTTMDTTQPNPLSPDTTTDRPPQPYAMTPAKSDKPRRRLSVRIEEPVKEKASRSPTKEEKRRHPPGRCVTCDRFGYHVDQPQRPATTAPQPAYDQARPEKPQAQDDSAARPKSRRMSSNKHDRSSGIFTTLPMMPPPHMMYPPHAPAMDYPPPPGPPYGWQPSPTMGPAFQYDNAGYGYGLPGPTHADPGYLDHSFARAQTPQHQSSMLAGSFVPAGDPNYVQYIQQKQLHAQQMDRLSAQLAAQSMADAARKAMPPPPVPPKGSQGRRPSMGRATTMDASGMYRQRPTSRQQYDEYDEEAYTSEEDPSYNHKRSSRDLKARTKPPTAWKGAPPSPIASRPANRKSASYSDGSMFINVASSQRDRLHRRSTDPLDQQVKDAEAYQEKITRKSGATKVAPETVRDIKGRTLASEAGTRHSFQSSVRGRRNSTVVSDSTCTNITMPGGLSLSIPPEMADQPLSISYGNMSISINGNETSPNEFSHDQIPRIERAPSTTSRGSRRSRVSGEMPYKGADIPRSATQHDYARAQANSAKRSSRAMSRPRHSREYTITPDYEVHEGDYTEPWFI